MLLREIAGGWPVLVGDSVGNRGKVVGNGGRIERAIAREPQQVACLGLQANLGASETLGLRSKRYLDEEQAVCSRSGADRVRARKPFGKGPHTKHLVLR